MSSLSSPDYLGPEIPEYVYTFLSPSVTDVIAHLLGVFYEKPV